MKFRSLLTIFFLAPISCMAKKESDFEKMLAGFDVCFFKDVYLEYTNEPKHEYFKKHGLKPYKIEDSMAYYHLKETFYGLPVSELIVPASFDIHAITIDLKIDKVIPVLNKHFPNGYYTDPTQDDGEKPVLYKSLSDPEKTTLTCTTRMQ
jgi:hypothetical protein